MVACIVDLSEYAARRRRTPKSSEPGARQKVADPTSGPIVSGVVSEPAQFCFWHGASGERYVHTVYSLIDCPNLPRANYILVGRDTRGKRTVLRVGRVEHDAASLNLAELRHRGAQLGACEVHVHLLAKSQRARSLINNDLRSGLLDNSASRPLSA